MTRSFTPEFKLEAASLVVDQNYSVSEACQALDVVESALRRWVGLNSYRKSEVDIRHIQGDDTGTASYSGLQHPKSKKRVLEGWLFLPNTESHFSKISPN